MATDQLNETLRDQFLDGMRHAASTVNIITTDGAAGKVGVTVSAMSSVSADMPKPTLLVCVHHQSPAARAIIDNGVFCVNVLKDDQAYISDTFAGRFKDVVEDKFEVAEWTPMRSGAPRVVDPLVAFDCRVALSDQVGTHYVFFGEVEEVFVAGQGSPLIYANRAYGMATRIDSAASPEVGREAADNALSVSCFHSFAPYILPRLVQGLASSRPEARVNLIEGDQRRIQESLLSGESEVGLLYDIDITPDLDTNPLTQLIPYVLLAEGHPLADKTEVTPKDLEGFPMVLLTAPPSRNYFTAILTDAGITPNIAFQSANFEMVRGMVGHGLGYALLATKPAAMMTYDGAPLISRPLKAEFAPSQVVITTRKGVKLSNLAEEFCRLCHEVF